MDIVLVELENREAIGEAGEIDNCDDNSGIRTGHLVQEATAIEMQGEGRWINCEEYGRGLTWIGEVMFRSG